MRTVGGIEDIVRWGLIELNLVTEREREVLIPLARGRSNAEIARELFVGESTVTGPRP